MRSLAEAFPTAIRVGGVDYPVNWDWRSCMRIITAFEDGGLTQRDKLELLVELLYAKLPPRIDGEVVSKAIKFLDCGEAGGEKGSGDGVRLYSFTTDAALIYAAFRQSHGIDLAVETLHWWAFCSLFLSLDEDCLFCRVVSLRDRSHKGQLTAQERKLVSSMGDLIKLPERDYTAEEQKKIEEFKAITLGKTLSCQ